MSSHLVKRIFGWVATAHPIYWNFPYGGRHGWDGKETVRSVYPALQNLISTQFFEIQASHNIPRKGE